MNPSAPLTALVVEPNVSMRARTVTKLSSAGFHVTAIASFEAARQRLVTNPPAVVITALKLGEYNGFHLVIRARTAAPRTAALVTSDDAGDVFRREARQVGATFVIEPVTPDDLLAAVLRTLFRSDLTTSIEPPFERRTKERRRLDAGFIPNRRAHERRRGLETLLRVASLS